MATVRELDIVTGAFGYTGRYITHRLLSMGHSVRTLTNHPRREHPLSSRIETVPLRFDDRSGLVQNLRGAATLYNTYWVRFPHGQIGFDKAVENTKRLIQAALDAGLRRIVHVSITNPDVRSSLPYFRGKAILEDAIMESGISYAIIRPTVIFGREDILINNIAWLLRRFPVFGIPGSGDYRLQPVFVEDLAQIAVDAGQRSDNFVMDAVGPEVLSFEDLVRQIAQAVGSRARMIRVSPRVALVISKLIGWFVGDVVLTHDELKGLMANLLVSTNVPTAQTRFSDWLEDHADTLGVQYASELGRHYR